jgi:hypothetical protein
MNLCLRETVKLQTAEKSAVESPKPHEKRRCQTCENSVQSSCTPAFDPIRTFAEGSYPGELVHVGEALRATPHVAHKQQKQLLGWIASVRPLLREEKGVEVGGKTAQIYHFFRMETPFHDVISSLTNSMIVCCIISCFFAANLHN